MTHSSLAPVDPVRPPARRRWWTAAVVGVVIVLVVAGLVAWRVTAAEPTAQSQPPGGALTAVFSELPASLRPPARVVDLPTDRGVGRGALIYHSDSVFLDDRTFERQDIYLVTASGAQFRIGRTPADTGPLNLSLSLDGRWLGTERDGRWRVRDLSGTTEYEVAVGYELMLWSTDARSVLLSQPAADGRTYATMALPGGEVRPLSVRTPPVAIGVAFVAGRELAVFDANPLIGPSAPSVPALSIALTDVFTGATRTVQVVDPDRTRPGEAIGPIVALWHAGGSPPTVWTEIGRPNLVPTDSPEGSLVAPSVALLGVDVTSGATAARIELSRGGARGRELCRGVVADGVVLQHWTASSTELIVVDPRLATRRVVTTLPRSVKVFVPGNRA